MTGTEKAGDPRFQVELPEPGAPQAIPPGPTAVFIAHGMGQQVPFDTLTSIACGLLGQDEARGRARAVDIGGERVERLEIQVDGKEVHIYEAYWAPLTEGAVRLRDVVRFLLSGAWNGIHAATKDGYFPRHVGGELRRFRIPASTVAALVTAALLISGLIVLNAAIAALVARHAAFRPGPVANDPLLRALTPYFELVLVLVGAAGLGVLLSTRVSSRRRAWLNLPVTVLLVLAAAAIIVAGLGWVPVILAHGGRSGAGAIAVMPWLLRHRLHLVFAWGFRIAAGLAAIYGLVVAGRFLWRAARFRWLTVIGLVLCFALAVRVAAGVHSGTAGGMRTPLAVLALLAAASAAVRGFFLEYVGDVAAYVQPHKVDRFDALRARIKDLVYNDMKLVYEARPGYQRVIVAGHSLGSVIVYDALNRLLNDDLVGEGPSRDVAGRTPLLLTFGSPLDKTAFIFHVNSRPKDMDAKEALATAKQPILEGHRPGEWVNVWSPQDIISGELNYYGPVTNVRDPDANAPLAAHVQYWDNRLVFSIMRRYL